MDYTCDLATVPRNISKLCSAIALQKQKMNVSKIKMPQLDLFTGLDEDYPVFKKKLELTFPGLGYVGST